MMLLSDILKYKFGEASFEKDIILQDDGQGPYIKKWDESLGPIPTKDQLEQWAIELEPIKYAIDQRENRRSEYPAIGDQLDAILKYLATKKDLTPELEAVKNQWESVKAKYPLVKV